MHAIISSHTDNGSPTLFTICRVPGGEAFDTNSQFSSFTRPQIEPTIFRKTHYQDASEEVNCDSESHAVCNRLKKYENIELSPRSNKSVIVYTTNELGFYIITFRNYKGR